MSTDTRRIRVTMTEKWISPNHDEAKLGFFRESFSEDSIP
jgi:hypothetical protein